MKTILIVEDDRDFSMGLAIRLKKSGYQVLLAQDAMQGVAFAFQKKPDLVILDLGLPAGGGLFVLERLKGSIDTFLIPIIVLTAQDPGATRDRVCSLGAEAYFQKPANNELLLATIAKALEAKG